MFPELNINITKRLIHNQKVCLQGSEKQHDYIFMRPIIKNLLLIGLLISSTAEADRYNGFDVRGSLIPADEIYQGGPPRDGIPALDKPKFISASKVGFLKKSDRVLGLKRNGKFKAYPISIMNWHEIVNDQMGHEKVVITYCPLCGTGVGFEAKSGQRLLTFGVSGLLYNSDVLLFDRETESLWSQIASKAIAGPMKKTPLTLIPLEHTTWGSWKQRYPNSLVLSIDTGHSRDYTRDPYAGYENSEGIYFPVAHRDPRYHPKERVLGIEINGKFKAYPFSELSQTNGAVKETFNGKALKIDYDAANQSARIFDKNGNELPSITGYWFAWYAFHPETFVFKAPELKN